MDITFRATEFEPDERLRERAQQKVAKLQRYLLDLERADIELSLEPTRGVETRRIARVNLILYGKVLLRAEAKAADPYVAVDAVVDNLKGQLLRYKGLRDDWRHHQLNRQEREREKAEGEESPEEESLEEES
ncbi:MAG: ribosome-associated translation inhibitor RaiA [Chloroflexi bacterium]|nr:ribosome-associated translation inhibitor RaiA [Chloroflexota bacterium]